MQNTCVLKLRNKYMNETNSNFEMVILKPAFEL